MKTKFMDQIVSKVAPQRITWYNLPKQLRRNYLEQIQDNLKKHSKAYANACQQLRGDIDTSALSSVGWVMGPGLFGSMLTALIEALDWSPDQNRIKQVNPVGQTKYRKTTVFPRSRIDRRFAPGYSGEIWTKDRCHPHLPGVCAILGAGNYEGYNDLLSRLFVDHQVVIYKPHDNNQSVQPILQKILQPLVNDGFLEFVAPDQGEALIHHRLVDSVLMTGGITTYNRIVWGPSHQRNAVFLSKQFDAELGAVSPYIIVPGQWSKSDLEHHAEMLVTAKLLNGGGICASPQVIIMDYDWPQRDTFLSVIRQKITETVSSLYHYPGSEERIEKILCDYSPNQIQRLSTRSGNHLYLVNEVSPGSLGTQEEAFGPLLVDLPLSAGGRAESFLEMATDLCNSDAIFGSLSCSIIIDPVTEAAITSHLDKCLEELEWGLIAVNEWAGLGLYFSGLSWGAYPKHTRSDIQSGQGTIGNAYQINGQPIKSILRGTFLSRLHLCLPSERQARRQNRLAQYFIEKSWWNLIKVSFLPGPLESQLSGPLKNLNQKSRRPGFLLGAREPVLHPKKNEVFYFFGASANQSSVRF